MNTPEFRLVASKSTLDFSLELTKAHAEGFQTIGSEPMKVTTDAEGQPSWHMLLVKVPAEERE